MTIAHRLLHPPKRQPWLFCALGFVWIPFIPACEDESPEIFDFTSTGNPLASSSSSSNPSDWSSSVDSSSTAPSAGDTFVSTFPGQIPDGTSSWTESWSGIDSTTGGTHTNTTSEDEDDTDTQEGDEGEGELEISEADILKIADERFYALSPTAGLVVLDLNEVDRLRILGKLRDQGVPFEMYVDQGQVFAMFNDYVYSEWNHGDGVWTTHSASRLVAIDATDPSAMFVRGAFEMPGTIADSRRIGDVLYLVTEENGYCWGCSDQPNTAVTSINIADPQNPVVLDQVRFGNGDPSWGYHSVAATDKRLYVGGQSQWNDDGTTSSQIDVIDVSAGDGTLMVAATVEIEGAITNRWQIDEYGDTLRVLSQQGWSGLPPVLQTFKIESSTKFTELGHLELSLPRPESLRSVRFDGTRAYAITFERTDPLFTLDLSDPAAPKQLGMLEIPGWVEHMEPRGDRVLALGYEPGNAEGSLHASLFDVSDLSAPTQVSRINFGGAWGSFAEDQNRLHKAFTIDQAKSLVAVPFNNWDQSSDGYCTTPSDGIALIDWSGDALIRRGVAPTPIRARRAILHDERLLALSDRSLRSFDISDRNLPSLTSEAVFSRNVNEMTWFGSRLIALGQQPSGTWELAIFSHAQAAQQGEALAFLPLALPTDWQCKGSVWPYKLLVHRDQAHIVFSVATSDFRSITGIVTVDLAVPNAPVIGAITELPFLSPSYPNPSITRTALHEQSMVQRGNYVVFAGQGQSDKNGKVQPTFEVVDLAASGGPRHVATLQREDASMHGGLLDLGGEIASWHARATNAADNTVYYYFDRIDFSNPANPRLAKPINTPGIVVALDGNNGAWSIDFGFEQSYLAEQSCYAHPAYAGFDPMTGLCNLYKTPVHHLALANDQATVLDTIDNLSSAPLLEVRGTSSRLFGVRAANSGASGTAMHIYGTTNERAVVAQLEVPAGATLVGAQAQSVNYRVHSHFGQVEATNLNAPWHRSSAAEPLAALCGDVEFNAAGAVCALGESGVFLAPWQ